MKKIGILGGMGPESTALFYMEVIRECQQQLHCKNDGDYPEIIVCSIPIPDIIGGINNWEETAAQLEYGLKKLENAGAEIIAVPCNTVQVFYDKMQKSTKVPILNIIVETLCSIQKEGFETAGLLCTETTSKAWLYQKFGKSKNIKIRLPENQEEINEIIRNVLEGKKVESDKEKLKAIISSLDADCVILGCTDLPVIISQADTETRLFDSIKELAKATVQISANGSAKLKSKTDK